MTKEKLQEVLKPLIKKVVKETVKEMLFEEGFLSAIIKECISGVSGEQIVERKEFLKMPIVTKSKTKSIDSEFLNSMKMDAINDKSSPTNEAKQRLSENLSKKYGIDVFAGTKAASPITSPSEVSIPGASGAAPGVFSGIAPDDPGVNLDIISKLSGGRFKV